MKVYRCISPDPYLDLQKESDDSVISRNNLLAPINLVRLARFRLLVRFIRTSSFDMCDILASALDAPRSWIRAVWADLE
eukprot:3502436-Karenia_brevis.AAC.1